MSRRVLLVDDVSMFLEIQKGFLKMSIIHILCARNGSEALATVKSVRPDLVIMDLHMPGMNGAECCAAIKSDPNLSSIPVIMATAAGKQEDHELCRRAGCDELLTKPFDRGLYLDAVRRHIPELDRREKRIPVSVKVRFQAFRVVMTGTVLDLSIRGLYLATDYDLDVGTDVTLVFALTNAPEAQVQAKGRVCWKNSGAERRKKEYPPGFGMEFSAFGEGSLAVLQRFIALQGG
ncbi:MAG TPA: response regulator [Geobacteraceae bacterium]|nr:response regulator [Geobacteraceae bacterium]